MMFSKVQPASDAFFLGIRRFLSRGGLHNFLFERISALGPITVAEFMKECLTNPYHGYYMRANVFGRHGDFITSPDICQIFGELIGVWFINEWTMLKQPPSINFIELGPGRGTLLSDILRVFSRFPLAYNAISLHLVEVSPAMRSLQENVLSKLSSLFNLPLPSAKWHSDLRSVPRDLPTLLLANEFFDALPVHQFQKSGWGWREVLVDIDKTKRGATELCFVLAPSQTSSQIAYLPLAGDIAHREFIEICPQALVLLDEVCQRVAEDGGSALLIDYGHLGNKGNTLRGFRRHELCHPLLDPGDVDLTCDVDFSLLRHRAFSSKHAVDVHGPKSQAYFLINMGLLTRLQTLVSQCGSDARREGLLSGCEMLITREQMGERFQFMSIVSRSKAPDAPRLEVPGFVDLYGTPCFQPTT